MLGASHSCLARCAVTGICAVYEKGLKTLNPAVRHITYDIADLYHYIDQLADLSCLV